MIMLITINTTINVIFDFLDNDLGWVDEGVSETGAGVGCGCVLGGACGIMAGPAASTIS